MPDYRIYSVGGGGRLQAARSFHAEDDASAVRKAATLHDPAGATELWQSGRLVGRFSRDGQFTAAPGPAAHR